MKRCKSNFLGVVYGSVSHSFGYGHGKGFLYIGLYGTEGREVGKKKKKRKFTVSKLIREKPRVA